MVKYTIDCTDYILNGENKQFEAMSDVVDLTDRIIETEDNGEIRATFFIKCDNVIDNDSFTLDAYGDDDFVFEHNRDEVNIYIKANKTPFDKNFLLVCTHANDTNVYIEIQIVQKAEEFKLEITNGAEIEEENKYTKSLQSLITTPVTINNVQERTFSNYNYYEEVSFTMNVTGGSKKYRITSLLKCHVDTDDNNNQTFVYYPFDNGFIYYKFENTLRIINYGRPFINENDYYIIKMCHEDYRDLAIELKLTYT